MLSLEFQSFAVRLAAVAAPPLLLLLFVATETSPQLDVDAWWGGEAEALGNLDEIELVDVEDRAKGMRGIRLKVGAVTFFGGLVQIVVLADELLELRLNVDDLVRWELELNHGHACFLQMLQESDFGRLQEHQTAALGIGTTSGTTDTVNVVPRVIGRVKLNNPVHSGDIQASSSHVSANQGTLLGVAKFEEGVGALLLFLLAVQLEHRQINVVQKLGVILDAVAT